MKSFVKGIVCIVSVILLFVFVSISLAAQDILKPEQYFGFKPGADRMMFDYGELIGYLQKIDAVSSRMKLVETGESPLGNKIYIAFISSEENIKNLEKLRQINEKLALDSAIPQAEREKMLNNGRVFFLATLSMHSGEVGPSQSAPLIAYEWITTDDPDKIEMLKNVVYMMIPCHNPDGMNMIVNHYRRYKGTKYEGCSMPGVYHKYVGHDNNRDFVSLTQSDNKTISRIFSTEWFPQVMVEKHQMGSTGPRYFVPPMHDPIAVNVPAEIWNWTWIFGSGMIKEMTKEGLAGVSQHYAFDDYWPGSTETCIWKNVVGLLTESASVHYATPIYIEPNELNVRGKGLSEYKKSINMPLLWPGGRWALSDIVDYEIVSTRSIINTASLHRREILQLRNDLCKKEVELGENTPPYYYIIPQKQHDRGEVAALVNLLMEHGVKVHKLSENAVLKNINFNKGDIVVTLAQAFRPFIKEVMEKQEFPERHYTPNGTMIRPYDITSWSLPLHRGVKAYEIDTKCGKFESNLSLINNQFNFKHEQTGEYKYIVFSVNNNESFKAAFLAEQSGLSVSRLEEDIIIKGRNISRGSFIIRRNKRLDDKINEIIEDLLVTPLFVNNNIEAETSEMKLPRIALVETYFHDMDAGWTRFVFDEYSIPFKVVHPGDFEKINFVKDFDVVVFPNVNKSELMKGKRKYGDTYRLSSYPPEYAKGIGKKGFKNLMNFFDEGGCIISWSRSTSLFMDILEIEHGKNDKEEFKLPIRDISEKLSKSGLDCAGSLMRVKIKDDHPITLGMQSETGIFFRGRPVFQTSVPDWDMDRRVIASFPEKDILLSGYCKNEKVLAGKSAMVWLKKGRGQLVLFGFCPQFRGSTQGCFKLLFNSLLLPKIR